MLEEGYDLVALGRAEETPISEADIQARIDASPAVKQSLADVVANPRRILGTYAGRGRDLAPWLADAEIQIANAVFGLQYHGGIGGEHDHRFAIFQRS